MAFHKTTGSDENRQFVHPELEDFTKLQEIGADSLQIPENAGRQYASLCLDYNPIHLHSIPAKLFGFKRAIVHGMWVRTNSLATSQSAQRWPIQFLGCRLCSSQG